MALPFGSVSAGQSVNQAMKKIFAETDRSAFSAEIIEKAINADFNISEPACRGKQAKVTDAALTYFPINRKITYEYEYTSTDFIGSKRLLFTIKNYSEKDATASVDVTIIKGNKTSKFYFKMQLKHNGIYSSNSFLSGPRLEIPSSIYRGKTWIENGNKNWISSIKARINLPAGKFENCVKIKTKIGNGDAGEASRYYAKGIGLIYEEWEAEDRSDILKLTSYSIR